MHTVQASDRHGRPRNDGLQDVPALDADRKIAPGDRSGTPASGPLSILALQRSAGNRAVGSLLRQAGQVPGSGRAIPPAVFLQREPDDLEPGDEWDEPSEEPESRPIIWPEDTEGEQNEPCFAPDFQAGINFGAVWADAAAAHLTAGPPDLPSAVSKMTAADSAWAATDGSDPGLGVLAGARSTLSRALDRVNVRIAPVDATLSAAANKILGAGMDVGFASTMMTEPQAPVEESEEPEEPEPCFGEADRAFIAEAASLAESAAAEFGKRPPDYRKALATLRAAGGKLDLVGGLEPGRSRLATIAGDLRRAANAVDAFLAPVEAVVKEAAVDVRDAADAAVRASEMSVPGRYAAGGGTGAGGAGGAT